MEDSMFVCPLPKVKCAGLCDRISNSAARFLSLLYFFEVDADTILFGGGGITTGLECGLFCLH